MKLALPLALSLVVAGCWQWHDVDPRADGGPAADAPACVRGGEDWFEPGCGSGAEVTIEPGCYQACEGPTDTSCPAGLACRRTDVNPCICTPGTLCCRACGMEQWLCLEPAPPIDPCEGRSYCDCNGECEPLIDLTHGCVCPCDEPFHCGGPACDCICGGAQYLGCAPIDACAETEVTCPSDTTGGLEDGCPTCALGI
jgi:hypothetical protein